MSALCSRRERVKLCMECWCGVLVWMKNIVVVGLDCYFGVLIFMVVLVLSE